MNYKYENELVADKVYMGKWIFFLFAGVIIAAISYQNITEKDMQLGLYFISAVSILLALLSFNDRTILRVSANEFIVVKYFFSKQFYKSYDISKIEELKYDEKVKSEMYYSSGTVKVLGMDVTPDSMNKYYYHNEIISFIYENKFIEFGKWKEGFDGKILYEILKEKISKEDK